MEPEELLVTLCRERFYPSLVDLVASMDEDDNLPGDSWLMIWRVGWFSRDEHVNL